MHTLIVAGALICAFCGVTLTGTAGQLIEHQRRGEARMFLAGGCGFIAMALVLAGVG